MKMFTRVVLLRNFDPSKTSDYNEYWRLCEFWSMHSQIPRLGRSSENTLGFQTGVVLLLEISE